ncbi:MAG: ATP-dependent DNA helicase, partial [Candidatus Woesebacteria bacterium]|nr:ATP-dependent DNA helicase [Candidatus Woesebacteria bacterium]
MGIQDKKLNKEQLQAINHKDGPLLIIAGAGTGKTTVITERVKNLILKDLAKPEEILALTFTEKAAKEMEERIDLALPYGYTQMWVMTFHSFCDRVLRDNAIHIGLDPKFKLMTEATSIQFIRTNLFEFDLDYFRPLGNPNKFIQGMLDHFSRLQDENVTPTEYLTWAKSKVKSKNIKISEEERLEIKKTIELSNAYKKYDELKINKSMFDFGDLITKTLELFNKRPNILKEYQEKFKYILVDEFQDTNYAQNELTILLSGKRQNITVVADDDQAIYRWRGAAVSNVIQFRSNFPKTEIIVLTKNYRSTQEILNRSYSLIQHNNPDRLEVVEKIDKKLVAIKKGGNQKLKFIHADRVENEADLVSQEIIKLVNKKTNKLTYKDFAILVRANNHADPFIRAFERKGISHQFLGPAKLFKQDEIIDLISYLKVLYNLEDSESFYRLLSIELFDINPLDLIKIGNLAKKKNKSIFEVCGKLDKLELRKDTKEKIEKIVILINKHLKVINKQTAGEILYDFLLSSGLLQNLLNPKDTDGEKKAKNIAKFFDKIKSYEVDHEKVGVNKIVDWIELLQELGESPMATDTDWTENNAVNILTIHSSKGLEFPVVFLVNLVTQRFPSTERREQIPIPEELIKEVLSKGDFHLQEERRLFYVGMTRAKERLFLTAADYYGEGKREKKLSPFIFEALEDLKLNDSKLRKDNKNIDFSDNKKSEQVNLHINNKLLDINYLSYSQIETFKTCPMHYKLRYIYKIPTPPSASISFGISIHSTFNEFYKKVKDGAKPTEKLIYEILKNNWINDGFSSKEHERKFFEKGKVYLSGFLKESFNLKNLPILLEQKFTIPLDKTLKIGGTIDRVDQLEDGRLEIMDYKTGATISTQKEVDNNLQLSFYALAATKILSKPFNRKPEEIKLSLYYLDSQEKISTTRTQKDLDKATQEIF